MLHKFNDGVPLPTCIINGQRQPRVRLLMSIVPLIHDLDDLVLILLRVEAHCLATVLLAELHRLHLGQLRCAIKVAMVAHVHVVLVRTWVT